MTLLSIIVIVNFVWSTVGLVMAFSLLRGMRKGKKMQEREDKALDDVMRLLQSKDEKKQQQGANALLGDLADDPEFAKFAKSMMGQVR